MSLHLNIRPELLNAIQLLSAKHNLALYRKVLRENDLINLDSLLTEGHFGIFFDKFCDHLQHDVKVFNGSSKTPDWILNTNGQIIIAEVYKLNPSEITQYRRTSEKGKFHPIIQQPLKLSGKNGPLSKRRKSMDLWYRLQDILL